MNGSKAAPGLVLIAEDDDDDFILTEKAMREAGWTGVFRRFRDGEELLAYLLALNPGKDPAAVPLLVILDLNMPRKDGREALKEVKEHPVLAKIPVVVFTTTPSQDDILYSYRLGGNSFIRKPESYAELVSVMNVLKRYWMESVMLPFGRQP